MVSVRAGLPFRAETARLSASEGFYYGIAVLSSLIFAIYLVFNCKFLVAGVSPLTFAFASNLVSSLCGLLYLLVSNTASDCTKIDRRIWPFVLVVGLSMGVGQRLLLFYGQSLTSATNTAFLLGMSPVFALLLAVFFLRESLRAQQLLIITGMMGGVFLLTTAGTLTVHLGDIIILISSLIVGAEKPLTRKILLSGVQPLLAVSLTLMIGTLGLFPLPR